MVNKRRDSTTSKFATPKFIEDEKERGKRCIYTGIVVIILNLYGYFWQHEIFINLNCVAPFRSEVR